MHLWNKQIYERMEECQVGVIFKHMSQNNNFAENLKLKAAKVKQ